MLRTEPLAAPRSGPFQTGPRLGPRTGTRLTPALRQAITLLSLTGPELDAWLSVALSEEAGRDPSPGTPTASPLKTSAPRAPDPERGWHARGWRAIFDPDGLEAPSGSLIAHVLPQIAALKLAPRARALALVLAEALEPTGWLGTPLPRLERMSGADGAEILAVLERLQQLEPAGIFARNLAECLALQAAAAGELTAAMSAILADLTLFASGGAGAIATRSGLPSAEILKAAGRLRGYDPKPGLAYAGFIAPAPPPDFRLCRNGSGWEIEPGDGLRLLTNGEGTAAIRQALERRVGIGQALCKRLVEGQADWLGGGELRPLTSRDLAAELGLHIATVNRALAALTLASPRGTLPLRALTARPVGPDSSSGAAIRARLRELLRSDAAKSDRELAEILAAEGRAVARRTVSKYRRMLLED